MKLLLPKHIKALEANPLGSQDGLGMNAIVHVKYFGTTRDWRWYITEADLEKRLFFGYVCGYEREWGYISMDELEELIETFGDWGGLVQNDLWFEPKPLYAALKSDGYTVEDVA